MPINTFNTTATPGLNNAVANIATTNALKNNGGAYISPGATGPGDEYNQLQPMSLALFTNSASAVSFPGILFEEEASNALSIHTYPNVANARVENLAANPTRYRIRAVLSNRIYPATTESWKAGTLFPNNPFLDDYTPVLIQLRNLLSGTTSDLLFNHPIDGNVAVQVEKWSFHLVGASMRDGCYFDIEMVTTIPQSPITSNLPRTIDGVVPAASSATAAYNGLAPTGLNPPGLNLTALFSTIANTILTVVANPLNVVPGIGSVLGFINSTSAIIGAVNYAGSTIGNFVAPGSPFVNNPSYILNNVSSVIQGYKTILGATPDPGEVSSSSPIVISNSNSTAISNSNLATTTASVPSTPASSLNYNSSSLAVATSILALNGKSSQGAAQFLQNVQQMLQNLQQFYIDQNNILCGPMIEALKQMSYQVLLQSNTLNNSTQTSNEEVLSFVTRMPTTLVSIARQYRQDIDDVLFLNPTLTSQILVPTNSTVYYYQGT